MEFITTIIISVVWFGVAAVVAYFAVGEEAVTKDKSSNGRLLNWGIMGFFIASIGLTAHAFITNANVILPIAILLYGPIGFLLGIVIGLTVLVIKHNKK